MTQPSSPEITIAGIKERDIDLLLVDEFVSDPAFTAWILEQTHGKPRGAPRLVSAARSVTQSQGESDVEIYLAVDDTLLVLLIENKITAGLQQRQAERYRQRATNYVRQGRCQQAITVLMAPQRYLGNDAGWLFDHTLPYERLHQWFVRQQRGGGLTAGRAAYRLAVLEKAITKQELGYQPKDDAPVSDFWQEYWHRVQKLAPELCMNKPGARPAKSRFFFFLPPGLPAGGRIVHKAYHGRVDLQFPGMGERLDELRALLRDRLDPDMRIAKANKAGVVRLVLPTIDTGQPFAEQRHLVDQGIQLAKRLLTWWQNKGDVWLGPRRT